MKKNLIDKYLDEKVKCDANFENIKNNIVIFNEEKEQKRISTKTFSIISIISLLLIIFISIIATNYKFKADEINYLNSLYISDHNGDRGDKGDKGDSSDDTLTLETKINQTKENKKILYEVVPIKIKYAYRYQTINEKNNEINYEWKFYDNYEEFNNQTSNAKLSNLIIIINCKVIKNLITDENMNINLKVLYFPKTHKINEKNFKENFILWDEDIKTNDKIGNYYIETYNDKTFYKIIKENNKNYIKTFMGVSIIEENIYSDNTKYEYGKYYNELKNVIIEIDNYNNIIDNKYIVHYGLLAINDLVKIINDYN